MGYGHPVGATGLMSAIEPTGFLPGRLNSDWKGTVSYACLTGSAQMATIWLKTYALTQDARFLNAALKLVDQLKITQRLGAANRGIRGGIAGSYPIWGSYIPYAYPNWAAKFFADARTSLLALM